MSAKRKENFWIELKVGSDLTKDLLSFRIDEKDLNIDDKSEEKLKLHSKKSASIYVV